VNDEDIVSAGAKESDDVQEEGGVSEGKGQHGSVFTVWHLVAVLYVGH
jgi:hypothetical protein